MSRQPRPLILIVLACALFLRTWVPAGWMPAASGGLFAIQPCPAAASSPATHAMHMHGGGTHDGPAHGGHHDGPCDFAPLLAGFVPLADAPALFEPATALSPLHELRAFSFLATGPPAPPPPATGPPALA